MPEVSSTRFLSSKKKRAYRPRVNVVLGQFTHAGFIIDAHFPRFGRISGAERAQRRAHAQNRAKRVRGGMGHGRKFPFDENASCHPRKDSGGASKRGGGSPLSCCGRAARAVICHGVGRVYYQDFNTRCVIPSQASSSAKGGYRPAWSRRWWAGLPVRGERATTGLRRALSEEAGEGTVLARPEAQLPGRARAVLLVANDEAKRPSGSQPRHLSMPSMNSTSRARPVRYLDGFGRGAQRGC